MRVFWILNLILGAAMAFDMSIYPEASGDQIRQVLELKERKKEALIEIEFGKDLKLDCNRYFLGKGELIKHDLKGFGYEYYELKAPGKDVLAGTLMGCLNGKKELKFVAFSGAKLTLRYNHRLPLVFYTPKDVRVRYRVFELKDEGFVK